MSRLRTPRDNPREYKEGTKVRIFLGYSTDTEIHVREGVVLGHRHNRKWAGSDNLGRTGNALVLRVEKTGELRRGNPGEVSVSHSATNYLIVGYLEMHRLKKQ